MKSAAMLGVLVLLGCSGDAFEMAPVGSADASVAAGGRAGSGGAAAGGIGGGSGGFAGSSTGGSSGQAGATMPRDAAPADAASGTRPNGAACQHRTECAGGICEIYPGQASGACVSCRKNTWFCSEDAQCCPGLVCHNGPAVTGRGTCHPQGTMVPTCVANNEPGSPGAASGAACCPGTLASLTAAGKCKCGYTDFPCVRWTVGGGTECCSGACDDAGFCAP